MVDVRMLDETQRLITLGSNEAQKSLLAERAYLILTGKRKPREDEQAA